MKVQPLVAEEPWSVLASLFLELDDGDAYPSSVFYALDEVEDLDTRPLLRAILRVAADLLRAEAERLRGSRGPQPPDPEHVMEEACEALLLRTCGAYEGWARSSSFDELGPDDRTRVQALADGLHDVEDRVQLRDAEIRASVERIFGTRATV